jgi:hypothetical protein
VQRGGVGDADDHALGRLESSDGRPHGCTRASWTRVKPDLISSSAAACTLSASTTSNSMLAWGAGRSAGHSGALKQAGRSLGSAAKRRSSGCRRWPHCASSRPVRWRAVIQAPRRTGRGWRKDPGCRLYAASNSVRPRRGAPMCTQGAHGLPSVRRRREPVASAAGAPAPYDADVTMMSGHRGRPPGMTLEPTGSVKLIAGTSGVSAGGGSSVHAWPAEYFHDGRHEHFGL